MADTITKILIRQGTDVQRRTANLTGIVFSSGEPGYCVDTKRLYIGDGNTVGGNAIGIQNLGTLDSLFGNYQNGLSYEAITTILDKGAAPGDIVYDETTRGLYSLTSVNTFPPLSSEFVKYDFVTLINDTQLEYNSLDQLQIKDQGVGPRQISFAVVDNYTIGKPSLNAPIGLIEDSVENRFLQEVSGNTFKCNYTNAPGNPQDLFVRPSTVLGRTATSNLTCFSFSTILQEATFAAQNGITINQAVNPPVFSLDAAKFTVDAPGSTTTGTITLKRPTTVQGALIVQGTGTFTQTLRCNQDVIAFFSSDRDLKENLKPLKNGLDTILKLTGYSFDWKNVASDYPQYSHLQGSDIGLVAQEVESVIPEAVETREDGFKGISYVKLIPYLVESIKDLKKEIDFLKLHNRLRG